jgi:predicted GNAT superfamily acetyltransferase
MRDWILRIIEDPGEMNAVEELQRFIWPGSETDIVPVHIFRATVRSGGLLIGAFLEETLVGFVFGFPGIYNTPDGPRIKHHSQMLGIHPDFRGRGIGFALKRAQWQMVRQKGIDRITWTYDPLLSRNAWLNITRLGAVCNTYLPDYYGEMRDEINTGISSDRFEVDWWVNSRRVNRRLSRKPRPPITLAQCLDAGAQTLNPTRVNSMGWVVPEGADYISTLSISQTSWRNSIIKQDAIDESFVEGTSRQSVLLVEIPAEFQKIKAADRELARIWRNHTQSLFLHLFDIGYLVTDFLHTSEKIPRSYYVLSHGESML